MTMCPRHAAESARWLDYRLPPAPIRIMSIGNPTHDRGLRGQTWAATIRAQQRLVWQACERECKGTVR